jgi:hemoglobin
MQKIDNENNVAFNIHLYQNAQHCRKSIHRGHIMSSLYDEIGGAAAVEAAVDIFYRRVLSDPLISHFFDSVDMDRQINKQKTFLTMAFGGPNQYTGKDMRQAHKHLKLSDEHFNAVAGHLVDTLQELHVAQSLIDEVMGIVASTHDDVINL